ncbi:MAG: hypothetical protein WCP35_05800 [Verrucomicrobiota bacterium]
MKKTHHISLLAGLAAALLTTTAQAQEKLVPGKDRLDTPAIDTGLCVHNAFQSNMVIQRDKPIRIWGWAQPGEKVSVTFGGKTQSATVAGNRSWTVEFPAQPANSQAQRVVVEGKSRKIEMENILIGDVWLMAGQSNMEFPLQKSEGGELEAISANFDKMRLLKAPQLCGPEIQKAFPRWYRWSDWDKSHLRQGFWDVVTPNTARSLPTIGYIFARRIHMATQIPIGILDVSRGGTCLETWTPMNVLKSIDTPEVKAMLAEWDKKVADFDSKKDLEARIKGYNDRIARMKAEGTPIPANFVVPSDLQPGPAMDMNRPANCYAGTLAPLAGLAVKGAIWHQGYNNALMPNGHVMYNQVFPEMIKAWRTVFNDPTMPFGIISQETEGDPQSLENFLSRMVDEGTYIRESHYQTFLKLRNAGDKTIGYASSFDQHRAWYHPQIKIPVGERIACWALATQYGKNIPWLPPQVKEVKPAAGKLVLVLDNEVRPYNDGPILGFAIAGKDGHFQPAQAQWVNKNEGKTGAPSYDFKAIVLTSPLVPEPLYFRHAWARNPMENLKNSGIPFACLRNDTWSLADMYELYTGKKTKTPGVIDGGESGQLGNALKAEDLKRRIEEAKTLLKANGVKTVN